eukprot:CAMPEP_0179406306 /NCGR_PEP_ID=MMETSP0799-20121207/811_1 /TAXON_ID=46947 /ORGANISM="Geminigera cryophila, Strain CCMP2564" /LENGTH=189 /DNA_ID=CAMNT_0021177335 /DNA_START=21 /DNA_END=590 /DNA_ORIENTATION=-
MTINTLGVTGANAAREIHELQETIRQCENDALKAREKAKQELAALRVMSARDLSKARLEGANRVVNEMEVLQAQSEAKDAIMSGIKVELMRERAALADIQGSIQVVEAELAAVRKEHRPCMVVIEDLRKKNTSLQVEVKRLQRGDSTPTTPRESHIPASSFMSPQPAKEEPTCTPAQSTTPRVHSVGIA